VLGLNTPRTVDSDHRNEIGIVRVAVADLPPIWNGSATASLVNVFLYALLLCLKIGRSSWNSQPFRPTSTELPFLIP